ncbi:hypothetical protein GQ457_04G016440 [Hibiscus cannabinus]
MLKRILNQAANGRWAIEPVDRVVTGLDSDYLPSRASKSGRNDPRALDFFTSDLRRPPSDQPGFKVCWSFLFGEAIDRWDLLLGAPIVGNVLGLKV